MLVRPYNSRQEMPVFGVYYVDGEAFCLCFPPGVGGLDALKLSDVELIDPTIWGKWVYRENNGFGVYHHALVEGDLLEEIQGYDEDAYKKFLDIIKAEGLVKPNFY